jgi:hypothetical protein
MKTRLLLACAPLLLLAALPTLAEKLLAQVTPGTAAGEGFTVRQARRDNGMVEFRITRDVTKATWPGRHAYLEVRGESGLIAECSVEPDRRKDLITYRFSIAPQNIRYSHFTVTEVQTDPNNAEGPELIGGGTYYEFRLADFAETAPKAE